MELGIFETKVVFGQLFESKYFDTFPENNTLFFTGMTVGYSPPFLPDLVLGFNKVLYKQNKHFTPLDLAALFWIFDQGINHDSILVKDTFDQMASLFVDWKFAEVDFGGFIWNGQRTTLVEILFELLPNQSMPEPIPLALKKHLIFLEEKFCTL